MKYYLIIIITVFWLGSNHLTLSFIRFSNDTFYTYPDSFNNSLPLYSINLWVSLKGCGSEQYMEDIHLSSDRFFVESSKWKKWLYVWKLHFINIKLVCSPCFKSVNSLNCNRRINDSVLPVVHIECATFVRCNQLSDYVNNFRGTSPTFRSYHQLGISQSLSPT